MRIRHAIQQYGGIAESLMHAFLSFAPVAAGPGDSEAERTFQLIQSLSDLISLREDRYLQHGATDTEGLKFILRVLNCFQLWGEMRSLAPHQFAIRLEVLKLTLAITILRNPGARLTDVEQGGYGPHSVPGVHVGSRTGTRLRSLSMIISPESTSDTQLSDFLHAIVPLLYLTSSTGWRKRTKWTSWFLALAVESASIAALPESKAQEKRVRVRRLVVESIIRQPVFDFALYPPARALSNLWNKVPILRDLNYLEYYLHGHRKYFYFHQ